jgi:hypothetical protein
MTTTPRHRVEPAQTVAFRERYVMISERKATLAARELVQRFSHANGVRCA